MVRRSVCASFDSDWRAPSLAPEDSDSQPYDCNSETKDLARLQTVSQVLRIQPAALAPLRPPGAPVGTRRSRRRHPNAPKAGRRVRSVAETTPPLPPPPGASTPRYSDERCGYQAKRRNQAVILDHLIPPMTRAENYGILTQLEHLIDEYYEAFTLDIKRATLLKKQKPMALSRQA